MTLTLSRGMVRVMKVSFRGQSFHNQGTVLKAKLRNHVAR